MQLRAVDQILEVDALAQIEDALQRYGYNATADTVLDSLRERSGLVIGPEVYTFSHKSVGEYLVSQCVVDGALEVDGVRLDRLKLLAVSSEDRWLNVLYFWAGSVPRSQLEEFVDELISASDMELALGVVWDQANRF